MAKRQRTDTRTQKVRRDERGRFAPSKKGLRNKGVTSGSLGNVPVLVAVGAGLIAVTAGAVITSAALRRNSQ